MSLRIAIIGDAATLRSLAPEWQELWRRVPAATPFQSPGWLIPWWDCFGSGDPRVVTARVGGDLAGILPLHIRDEPERRKLLPLGISLSDYLDALVDPAVPNVADALLGAISDIECWDECCLPDLPPNAALATAATPAGVAEQWREGEVCPVLPLPAAIDGLATALPQRTQRYLRRARKVAGRAGGVSVEAADGDGTARCLDDLFRLNRLRWGDDSVCADPAVCRFHRLATPRLHALGVLRLYRLSIRDVTSAVYYGFLANGNAYGYLTGFDEREAIQKPGAQIIAHAIEQAINEGTREFHLLRGGESYKFTWGAEPRRTFVRTLTKR